ncbi:MAG: class C sortase, partial [Clostridia bacterium]|nr:class C sortase [Clostridia bacterium]
MKTKRWPTVILVVVFIIGLGIFLYPTVSNFLNRINQSRVIKNYEDRVAGMSHEEYNALIDQARAYNEEYAFNSFAYDEFMEEGTELYRRTLNVSGGVMGYLKID